MSDVQPGPGGENLRVIIVAENASLRSGGESAIPVHYFRTLRSHGVDTWLLTHSRWREELEALLPEEADRMAFVPDTAIHKALLRLNSLVPEAVGHITFSLALRMFSQRLARGIAKEIISREGIDVVHQPTPVSPRDPSWMFGLGVPVVIGPMNGGMTYPKGFAHIGGRLNGCVESLARLAAGFANRLVPGKRRAEILLVANDRTKDALPATTRGRVVTLPENGVALQEWPFAHARADDTPRFTFVGRLVPLKAVDLLLEAFKRVKARTDATLEILGDGSERERLERLARRLGIEGSVTFFGWCSVAECAQRVREADVSVFPSVRDCGGASVLESLASGRPVVAAGWGGPIDYLDDTCGILAPVDSEESLVSGLAAGMLTLAGDPDLRARMGRAGREKVERHFDWDRKVDFMREIYAQAITIKRGEAAPNGRHAP